MANKKNDRFSELLETEDIQEQEKRIEHLKRLATAPIVHVTIVLDTRTGGIEVSGTPMAYDYLYRVLDEARRHVAESERKALLKKEEKGETPSE